MRPLVVKLLVSTTTRGLLRPSIELAASLTVRPVFTSDELLSVWASFAKHPMLYLPSGHPGSAGERILTEVWKSAESG